ncbi:hypothetical protein GCM10027517_24810 [Phycicoccus ginsengisoli]
MSTGLRPASRHDRVVVRAPWPLLWVGGPAAAALWVGMLAAVRLAVAEGDWMAPFRGSGIGAVGSVVGWLLVAGFLVVLPVRVWYAASYREVLDADGVRLRVGRRRTDTSRERVVSIRYVDASSVDGRQRPSRVFVMTQDHKQPVARFTARDRGWRPAVGILAQWLQQRPELAADARTREFFEPHLDTQP